MKKYIILLFIMPLVTGCFNYQELNNMAIITTIGIKKNKDKYEVTLKETMPKKADNKIDYIYKYYKSTSTSIPKAINKINDNTSKDIYLPLVQNIIITESSIIKDIPTYIKGKTFVFVTSELDKVLKTNSNYRYLNNITKKNVVLLKELRKNTKKDIPHIKIYQKELLIKN